MMQTNAIDKDVMIQQWQTCVDMANSISQRRDTMNNLLVTLNLAIVATVTIVWDLKSLLISFVGIVICCVWWRFITYFKHLNKAKFSVISELEQSMQIKPFTKEWEILCKDKKFVEGTKLERIFPVAFGIVYITVIVLMICMKMEG